MKKIISLVLIDDDESFIFIVKQLLNKLSPRIYQITSFTYPKEAFFEIDSNPHFFDIIISDFDMPDLDGLQLFQSLINSNISIPFILLTGNQDVDLPSKALNAGIKFFLRKENDILAIIKQLDQLIKITVRQVREDSEIIENIKMTTDFFSLITNSFKSIDNEIYSQLLFRRTLESLITVSESEYGFINEVKLNSSGEYILSSTFLTLLEWNPKSGYAYKLYEKEIFPFRALKRFYEGILVEKNSIFENNLQNMDISNANELLEMDITLKSFLGLPIFFKDNLVGILGLINKTEDFKEADLLKLQPFVMNLANYMHLKMFVENLQQPVNIV